MSSHLNEGADSVSSASLVSRLTWRLSPPNLEAAGAQWDRDEPPEADGQSNTLLTSSGLLQQVQARHYVNRGLALSPAVHVETDRDGLHLVQCLLEIL